MLSSIAVAAFPDLGHLCSECKAALHSTPRNFRCSKISIGRVSAEESGVVVEARGHHVPIRKGFGTQGSAEVVIDLHWIIQII
jgi:hypothetical protein